MGATSLQNFNDFYQFIDLKRINKSFICIIQNIEQSKIRNGFYQLTILFGSQINKQFLFKSNALEKIIEMYKIYELIGRTVEIRQFDFIIVDNSLYIEIKNLLLKDINKNNINIKDEFFFAKTEFIRTLKEITTKNLKLFSIYLEYTGNNTFIDIDGQQIEIKLIKELKRDTKYYFSNLFYEEKKAKYTPLTSHYNIDDPKLLEIEKDNIISGSISEIFFYEDKISLLTNTKKTIILLNNRLMKKISPNALCSFIFFDNYMNNQIKYNAFSNIICQDITMLNIHIKDLKEKNNKYNIIEVNSHQYTISRENIEIPIISINKNSSFLQSIIYKNSNNSNQVEFLIELYKCKINNYISYLNLNQDGYSYDFIYESKSKDLLPDIQEICLDNKNKVKIENPDTFGNNFKEKFGIINIPKQPYFSKNKIIDLNKINTKNINKIKSKKILILINKNNDKRELYFKLTKKLEQKYDFKLDLNYEEKLSDFYKEYKNNLTDFFHHRDLIIKKYDTLFKEEKSAFSEFITMNLNLSDLSNDSNNYNKLDDFPNNKQIDDNNYIITENNKKEDKIKRTDKGGDDVEISYRKYFELGFKNYIFDNSQEEFEKIKKLGFLFILKYYDYSLSFRNFEFIITNYFDIINDSSQLDYLERISVIIAFVNDKIFDEDNRESEFKYYQLIDLDNEKTKNNFNYCLEAYNSFFKIIDKLEENSAFFTILGQFNSLIYYETTYQINMYSGTMLSLNDIKLEIFKMFKRHFFLTTNISDCYAHCSPYTKLVFYHPLTFLNSRKLRIEEKKIDNSALAMLFLIFHINCGHFKSYKYNLEDTPKQFYDNNYEIAQFILGDISDLDNIFEYYLTSNMIKISEFYQSTNLRQLLLPELYIQEDFTELNKILNDLGITKKLKKFIKEDNELSFGDINNMPIREMMIILYELKKKYKNETDFNNYVNQNEDLKEMMDKVSTIYKKKHYKP